MHEFDAGKKKRQTVHHVLPYHATIMTTPFNIHVTGKHIHSQIHLTYPGNGQLDEVGVTEMASSRFNDGACGVFGVAVNDSSSIKVYSMYIYIG